MNGKNTNSSERTAERSTNRLMATLHASTIMDRRARILCRHIAPLLPDVGSVLDVGAGNGKLSGGLLEVKPNLSIQGIDTHVGEEEYIPVEVFDGLRIPFRDDAFDVCLVSDVLHHSEGPFDLLTEIGRVSSRYIVVKDHIANSRFDFTLLKLLDWLGNRGYGNALPYNYWSWREWEAAFARLGLEIDSLTRHLRLYPTPLSVIFDRNLHFVARLRVSS